MDKAKMLSLDDKEKLYRFMKEFIGPRPDECDSFTKALHDFKDKMSPTDEIYLTLISVGILTSEFHKSLMKGKAGGQADTVNREECKENCEGT